MKTRPGSQKASRTLNVHLVSEDAFLRERLASYCRRHPLLQLSSGSPVPLQGHIDVLLFPARRFLLEQGERPRPRGAPGLPLLLAYGEARLLGPCFLAGCDDYLREPWDPEELGWRLERRLAADARGYRLPWGGLVLRGLSLSGPGGRCALSYPEARILRLLLQSRAVPVPREALYYAIWGRGSGGRSRVVDVHVSKVRRKLLRLAPGSAGGIRAVRGVGYLMG